MAYAADTKIQNTNNFFEEIRFANTNTKVRKYK